MLLFYFLWLFTKDYTKIFLNFLVSWEFIYNNAIIQPKEFATTIDHNTQNSKS